MEKEIEDSDAHESLRNLSVQAENPAFASEEMIACGACARSNPPTRAECLYCGATLELSEEQRKFLKPNLRQLEAWEKGFNLIVAPDQKNVAEPQIERAAALLKLDAQILRRIIELKKSLPLARVETEATAETIQKNLRETANIETKIVADEDLNPAIAPRRLRAMEFSDEKLVLILFNAEDVLEIAWTDLILIVTGTIFERRVRTTETRAKSGGESKLIGTNETSSDALLIDFYNRGDSNGFRVEQKGFDFSCLGAEKGLLAAENLRFLVKLLSRRAPEAKIIEDYAEIRVPLAAIWAVEERTESRGLTRDRFAKFNHENLTTINNSAQFTKYSRLQRQLV